MATTDDRAAFLATVPLFAGLDAAELSALARACVGCRFAAGTTIFHQGEPGATLYVVQSGLVRIYVLGDDGQERSVSLCGPREIFGELALIDEAPRSASTLTLGPVAALALTRERFAEGVNRSPALAQALLRLLSGRLRAATEQVGSTAFHSVGERLARTLLALAGPDGGDTAGCLSVALTQSDLASLVGASRESVNRALRGFQRRGLVALRQGRIVVLDPQALAQGD